MSKYDSFESILPIISLYAFAGYRLIPALQQIYRSSTQLRFVGPALDVLYNDLSSLKQVNPERAQITPLILSKNIQLEKVSYRHPYSSQSAIKFLDINIPVHSTVGFVGVTGSGKSTAADLILGLLEPQKGLLKIDDQPITASNRRQWQSAIGYVPQHIYLTDDSVAANIAFGVRRKRYQSASHRASCKNC